MVPGASATINAHGITNSWVESEVTWNSRMSGVSWTTPGGDYSGAVSSSQFCPNSVDTNTWKSWDVTSLVQGWVNGGTNNGVLLKDSSSTSACKWFYSSDYGDASKRPKLSVCYT